MPDFLIPRFDNSWRPGVLPGSLGRLLVAACVAACCGIVSPAVADDPADTPAAEPDDKPVPEQALQEKITDGKVPEDDDLLQSLDSDSRQFVEQALDHLQSAFDGMQTARRRIAQEDTGAQTQKTQERVVKELEDLLTLVRKQQSRSQKSSQQNQNSDANQDQRGPERQKLQTGQNDPQNSDSAGNTGKNPGSPDKRRKDGKSSDAQERTDAARSPSADEARRRQVIKDVWGHLPPHVREAMLNSVSERYLPKYEDLVKKYYEDLAEKNRKPSGK